MYRLIGTVAWHPNEHDNNIRDGDKLNTELSGVRRGFHLRNKIWAEGEDLMHVIPLD
jgi:hypothetical protein